MNIPLARYLALLRSYLRPRRAQVMLLAALLLAGIALQLANPQIVGYFIDTARAGGPPRALEEAALLFIAIALLQRGVALAAFYVGADLGWSATNALRADLARHVLGLDMSFHKTHTPGELIERIDGDITRLANLFSQLALHVLGNGVLVLGILALLFRVDWRVGLGLTLYTLLTALALRAIQRRAVRRWAASRQASAEQYGFLEERISGTEDLRASGAEAYVLRRLYGLARASLEKERAARLVSNLTFMSTNGLYIAGYTLGLALGAYLYTRHHVSIGTAYLIVFYIGMLATPLETIRQQVQDLQRAAASLDRVEALLSIQPQVRETVRAALPAGPLRVDFAGVSFGYDVGESVLRDVSFCLEPGEVLGLLGRTGSGKSTLARLLFRLYDPTIGSIRLGGVNPRDLALADLRERVGMVTQEVQLFQTSIRDNLTFFHPHSEDSRILRVLDELGLGAWYRALPDGLDTMLAAAGQGLSAGEAQLLAFVRVFLKDPGLVLLDEASSRLDPATERLLERALDRLLDGRTGIIIAHRLQTVRRAHKIMVLEGGRIVEYGPRERLAADPASRFSYLLQTGLEESREEVGA